MVVMFGDVACWCQSVEYAFTSPVSMESVMLVMCSMQYVMSASSVT